MDQRKIAVRWNEFVGCLIKAKELWNEHREDCLMLTSTDFLPLSMQQVLASTTNIAEFEVALDRLNAYWRAYGGLEEMLIPEEDIPPEEGETPEKKASSHDDIRKAYLQQKEAQNN